MIAYEPSELIGSRDKSVATENPATIKLMVESYKNIPVLVGAGVHSADDVKTSLKLGAKGILLATDVVRSNDPERELTELVGGFSV